LSLSRIFQDFPRLSKDIQILFSHFPTNILRAHDNNTILAVFVIVRAKSEKTLGNLENDHLAWFGKRLETVGNLGK